MHDTFYDVKARIISVLANPTRLEILDRLSEGERTVSDLSVALGIGQATTSQHLAVMRNAGVVDFRKQGNRSYYRLADPEISKACGVMGEAVVRLLVSRQENLLPVFLAARRQAAST
jgi:DNA-binding transcriptional ArsR family regulator